MRRAIAFPLAAVCLAAATAHAQPLPQPSAGLVMPGDPSAMGNMAAAMASAVRQGDETLSCEALRAELEAARNAPAMKAYQAATTGATRAAAEPPAPARAREAAPLVPPLAAPAGARGAASPPSPAAAPAFPGMAQQAQAIASMQAQMNALAPVLPLLARNQHLVQLAAAKQCPWLTSGEGFGVSAAGAAAAGAGARGDER